MSEFMIVEAGQPPITVATRRSMARVDGVDVPVLVIKFSSEVPADDLERMSLEGDCCTGCEIRIVGKGQVKDSRCGFRVLEFQCTTAETDDISARPCRIKAGLDVV